MIVGSLMCDASFSDIYHLGGCAGGFSVLQGGKSVSREFSGVLPDVKNPSEAEMLAIAMGAKEMSIELKRLGVRLDKLYIYTDSLDAIEQYRMHIDGDRNFATYDHALRLMRHHLSDVIAPEHLVLEHIKAHVDPTHATPLQTLHNRFDVKAKEARWAAQNHLLMPKDFGKYYGIVLPSNAAVAQMHDLKQLGYVYAKMGLSARAVFVGAPPEDRLSHPFVQGIWQAAQEAGRPLGDFWEEQGRSINGDPRQGCEGLDRTLLRRAVELKGMDSNRLNFTLPSSHYAAMASRLLFGPQPDALLDSQHPNGRLEPASQFVVSVFERGRRGEGPYAPNEWLEAFAPLTTIPLYLGVKAALEHACIPEAWRLRDPFSQLKSTIKDVISTYGAEQSHILMHKLVSALNQVNVPLLPDTRNSVLKCMSTHNAERLTQIVTSLVLRQEESLRSFSSPADVGRGEVASQPDVIAHAFGVERETRSYGMR